MDMDSQANVTDFLTQQDIEVFERKTVLEGFMDWSVEDYIYMVSEKLHIVPSDGYLATLAKLLYTSKEWSHVKNKSLALKTILEPIINDYDYILIDTPPSLSGPMVNAICAADYVLVLAEGSKWAFNAVSRFLETVYFMQEKINPGIEVLGILRTLSDARRVDSKAYIDVLGEMWSELVFDTVIKRKASIGRLSI